MCRVERVNEIRRKTLQLFPPADRVIYSRLSNTDVLKSSCDFADLAIPIWLNYRHLERRSPDHG